tara:strand:- start:7634 stop:8278 length:645 start_codon:yes stop_codon:yes gene_type:complete
MLKLPSTPISPTEFIEEWLPRALEVSAQSDEFLDLGIEFGVVLTGEGGGEWLITVQNREAIVAAGSRDSALFTIIQSVADWRGALWEEKGGAIGKQASRMFQPGAQRDWRPGEIGGPPAPEALEEIGKLDGLIRVCVTEASEIDWAVDFKVGPGPIPEEPSAILEVTAEDAEAMENGDLDPLDAFLGGKMLVTGDMALVMQIQAIQMQAAQGAF